MTDETASLVLEIPRRMQGDLASVKEEVRLIRVEITEVKQHMAAFTAHPAVAGARSE